MEEMSRFLGMLLYNSGANVLGNMLANKGVERTSHGRGVISTGKTEQQQRAKQNKERLERGKIFNAASFFYLIFKY